jgi:hypothetical protein
MALFGNESHFRRVFDRLYERARIDILDHQLTEPSNLLHRSARPERLAYVIDHEQKNDDTHHEAINSKTAR